MYINRKYKRNVDSLVDTLVSAGKKEVFVTSPVELDEDKIAEIGFSLPVKDGTNVVPNEFGRFTSYNLNGKTIVRKDLPKEHRVVNTIYWTWKTWDGVEHEEFTDVIKLCYQREYIFPPSELIIYSDKHNYIISEKIDVKDKTRLLHIINMFLEIFGSCNVVDDELNVIPTKQVPWEIFPEGEYPWSRLSTELANKAFNAPNKRKKQFIEARFKHLKKHQPNEIAVGQSNFRNYLAFIYASKGMVVLESTALDNATYVFNKNWQDCSKLTKAEVINGNLHKDRVVHQKSWFDKISNILGN